MVFTPDELEKARRAAQALARHARGLVHLRAARLEEARADISRAYELWTTQPDVALLAAELAERDGDLRRSSSNGARSFGAAARVASNCVIRSSFHSRSSRAIVRSRSTSFPPRACMSSSNRSWHARAHAPSLTIARARICSARRRGGRITSDSLRRRVTVVIATEPWCTGCKLEAPELAKLQRRYRGRKDAQFLVVTDDPYERATVATSERLLLQASDCFYERATVVA